MNAWRLMAIALIFFIAAGAWLVLGASVEYRTTSQDRELKQQVGGLWGAAQRQRPPVFERHEQRRVTDANGRERAVVERTRLSITSSDLTADFDLDQRRKGLLWYSTYAVDYAAAYTVANPSARAADTRMRFTFPAADGVYDGFAVLVDGKKVPVEYGGGRAEARFRIPAAGKVRVDLGYRTQGLDSWTYVPSEGVGAVRDFSLAMTTDFTDVDFPDGSVSPTSKQRVGGGWRLVWRYDDLVSGRDISLSMPKPLNPGPVAWRMSLFAPISLMFFFAALVLNQATAKVRVHPVNYAFLAAGFFAFHLLFAYLVDRVDVNVAFAVSALTSVLLCVGYLRLLIGDGRTLVESAVGQLVFLVLFSYTFFFEGYTGLAVTIGAVVTLGYYMAKTGRVDWEEVFASAGRTAPEGMPDMLKP